LVEALPESVLEGVRRGKIGAWGAMKYLLPLARANGPACERLAEKISGIDLTSRQVGLVCRHYAGGGRVAERILEDPVRFLRALEEARKGPQDLKLSEAENRAFKQLDLIGKVALGLTRSLPEVLGYDGDGCAREKLWSAWGRSLEWMALLEKTMAGLKVAETNRREGTNARPGTLECHIDVAQPRTWDAEDRQGPWGRAENGSAGDSERERPGA
jgi:hypothetical protein